MTTHWHVTVEGLPHELGPDGIVDYTAEDDATAATVEASVRGTCQTVADYKGLDLGEPTITARQVTDTLLP